MSATNEASPAGETGDLERQVRPTFLPEIGNITHGKCRDMYRELAKMSIGDVITVELDIGLNNKSVLSKRLGIKVSVRKNGDMLDIYRIA